MKNEGFLLIDHSASPGLTPADFEKVGITEHSLHKLGLSMVEFGEGKRLERASKRCCHCGNIVYLHPERIKPRNFCRTCPPGHDYVCDRAECHYDCKPYRKKLEKIAEDWLRAERIKQKNPGVPDIVTLNLPDKDDPAPSILR